MNKLISVILLLAVFYTVASAEESTPELSGISVGDIVTFGHYEQDNDLANGPEPIEWIVLDYDETNHKVLLLSRYGLDTKPFNTGPTSTTWERCTLRSWMNNEFMNAAFSAEEQSYILITEVDTGISQGYSEWHKFGENDTQDRIFLLSYAEANR